MFLHPKDDDTDDLYFIHLFNLDSSVKWNSTIQVNVELISVLN